jgi:hypothetical protein
MKIGKFEMTIKSVLISLVVLVLVLVLVIMPLFGFTMFGRESSVDKVEDNGESETSGKLMETEITQGDIPIFANDGDQLTTSEYQSLTLNRPDEIDVRVISDIHQLAPELRADNDVWLRSSVQSRSSFTKLCH